jgi:alpha-ketoglutarate-dependent taurine dioxygenase
MSSSPQRHSSMWNSSLASLRSCAPKPPATHSAGRRHRNALRAIVAEHGVVLVRGLGLRDAAATTAVFRRLATTLMSEKEAFARPQVYAAGVYSSASWPANQQMCMHHELSYRLEVPSLMLFACLGAPTRGGATAVRDSPTVLTPASRSPSEHSARAEIVELINAVYEDNTVREPWQAGDLMLIDNVRTAHTRGVYEGPRSARWDGRPGTPGRLLANRP